MLSLYLVPRHYHRPQAQQVHSTPAKPWSSKHTARPRLLPFHPELYPIGTEYRQFGEKEYHRLIVDSLGDGVLLISRLAETGEEIVDQITHILVLLLQDSV